MAALSNLAKFLGVYLWWRRIIENHGLKWGDGRSERFIISRMTNEGGSVLEWIKRVKRELPELSVFMDFLAFSGLRFKEAVNSYNLVIDLTEKRGLNKYYNVEKESLEHYRFERLFIRRCKKAFVSFISREFIKEIGKQKKLTQYQINNWVRRDKRLRARFCDVREYWATFMLRWLNRAEIDFLQGRIGVSTFMKYYFNPTLITDLKERVFKGLAELMKQL